jgi:hypothetical protein
MRRRVLSFGPTHLTLSAWRRKIGEPEKERTMSFFGDLGRATRNGMNRVVEIRQRQAQRYVNGVLLAMDDEALIRAGYDRKILERQESSLYPI